jgi:L-fucose isomerase-like protein
MADPIRLGITAVASPLEVGAGDAPMLLERLRAAAQRTAPGQGREIELIQAGPAVDPASAVATGRAFYDQRVDAICVIAASWFEDYLILDLVEECDVPVILWARPGMETGSLCGMQQIGFMLKQLGRPYCFLFDEPGAVSSIGRAYDFGVAAGLRRRLRRARIGYLGHRVEGMTETTPHELALKKLFGPRVAGLDTQVFLDRVARVPVGPAAQEWEELKKRVGRVTSSQEAGIAAMQVYRALRDTIHELGLAGVAVGCYPHLMGKVCLGISLLAEEGIPVACEGDVNGALGMIILSYLTGHPVHNTDLLDPIPADNAIVYSHCGNGGFSLASDRADITLGPVRLMNSGVCAQFPARPGPVTLVNIVPTLGSYRLAAVYGEAILTDMVFPGNPLRVRFRSDYRHVLDWIAREGLGHHWMGGYGDVRRPIADLAKMAGCEFLSME